MVESTILHLKLREIHAEIAANHQAEVHLGGLGGKAGLALFEFYYSRLLDDDQYAELGMEIISGAIDRINEGYQLPTYCAGIAGLAWVIDHLVQEKFIDNDVEGLFEEIEDYLFQNMEVALTEGLLDFLHGASGYGYYFLKRYQSSTSAIARLKYQQFLQTYLTALDHLAEKNNNFIKWKCFRKQEDKNKGYDLSLAHGQSSLLNLLSRLATIPEFEEQSVNLLQGGIAFINHHKSQHKEKDFSFFPNFVKDGKPSAKRTRVAWCYGDLGVGLTLWRAAKVLKDERLMRSAQEILEQVSDKRHPDITGVEDAGFCHGSFGLAHIFLQLYRETAISKYQKAADFWLEDGLKKASFADGYAGYKQWLPGERVWSKRLNTLEGVAGIGLTLISFLDDQNPCKWDASLLLS